LYSFAEGQEQQVIDVILGHMRTGKIAKVAGKILLSMVNGDF